MHAAENPGKALVAPPMQIRQPRAEAFTDAVYGLAVDFRQPPGLPLSIAAALVVSVR
jgi:hypothetical protein